MATPRALFAPFARAYASASAARTFTPPPLPTSLAAVTRVFAVASGKGGVGKSTTCANLACALARLGHRVGLLDADVFGPSVPTLMQLSGAPAIDASGAMLPLENHGVRCQSMGFLIPDGGAAVWRGPMVSGALTKMIHDTKWGDIDVLMIDMPPGTGDAQISISQKVPLTGVVIVSTPQEVALADARRGIDMYGKVNTPIVGVVENMAYYLEQDGSKSHVFGEGGARRTAKERGVPFLGEVPLDTRIRAQSDSGVPIVVAERDGVVSQVYKSMAEQLMATTAPFAK
jgi:ATP-binding protein involved in chromosome partitioning